MLTFLGENEIRRKFEAVSKKLKNPVLLVFLHLTFP